jgi:hypothetical protein
MKRFGIALAAALIASSLVGVKILLTDSYLWFAAPSHAYGLIGFVCLDVAVAVALWNRTRIPAFAAVLLALVQFGAMAGDLFIGSPTGVPATVFRAYLLGDESYVLLLGIQPIIAGLAVIVLARRGSVTIDMRRYQHPMGVATSNK